MGGSEAGNVLAIASIAVAALLYLVCIFATRAVTGEDLALLPFGRFFARFLPHRATR
jgi:hypothetical protein